MTATRIVNVALPIDRGTIDGAIVPIRRRPNATESEPPTQNGEPAAIRGFPTVRILEIDPPPAPAMHVERLLLSADINFWLAHGGLGKTTLLLYVCVCVAIGRAVFGTLGVKRTGRVLLVLPEDGEGAARMMLDAIVAGMELDAGEREVLADRLIMISDEALVNITTDARRLRDTAIEHEVVLVALDPLRNLLGDAPEIDNDVAGACCDMLRREVCRGAGATVLLTHHNRKPGKDAPSDPSPSAHDARGAGGWVNGSRLVFSITKSDDRITMTAVKSNRVKSDLRHDLTLAIESSADDDARWTSCRVTDANIGAASTALTPGIGRVVNDNEKKALSAVDDRLEPGRRVSWSEWLRTSGLKADTLKSIKNRLIDAALIKAHAAGKHRNGGETFAYSITERGAAALETGWAVELKGERVRG